MSSHREAPEISKDPVADSTDLYAFVSPDAPTTVTLIANYIPLEGPDGGPNFYEFGDDVLYEIHIDNNGDAVADITYQFRFQTKIRNPDSFLYNVGQIGSISDTNWNRPQFYSVTKVKGGVSTVLGTNLPCPPCNIGPRSTPNYATAYFPAAINTLASGEKVFAGQREEGFYVDLGSIFDLAALRPFQSAHLINPPASGPGVDSSKAVNVHSIAIQIPKTMLTSDGSNPTVVTAAKSVIGVWTSASRRKVSIRGGVAGANVETGPWVQVSRLGNPLINEVIIPMGKKDLWNALQPKDDAQFLEYAQIPELSGLLPVLYPGVFPNLAALNATLTIPTKVRADIVAILMTGLPTGIVGGFQNFTGTTIADMLRLNMAIPPAGSPNVNGILGGDLAGFPNGRRVFDDVATIEIRALAGLTYQLVATYTPDGAAGAVSDFQPAQVPPAGRYIANFPYLGVPLDGYDVPS